MAAHQPEVGFGCLCVPFSTKTTTNMIKPKFSEWMLKRTTQKWILRFWFESSKGPLKHYGVKVDEFLRKLSDADPEDVDAVGKLIEEFFTPEQGLAACEVTNRIGDGAVHYFDWP